MRRLGHGWLLILALGIAAVWGCGGDDEPNDDTGSGGSGAGVFVVNEGNFGKGNGSLSFYDPALKQVANNVFEVVNGKPLGDTPNDIAIRDGKAWIVVNNSQRIEVIDTLTRRSVGAVQFADGGSPYTITLDAAGAYGYVPLFLGNALAKVNLTSMKVEKLVEVGGNPTEVALANGKAYVTNSGGDAAFDGMGSQVAVVNVATMSVDKLIQVGDRPTSIVAAPNGDLVVLCTGFWDDYTTEGADESTPGSIVVIDSKIDKVVEQIPLDAAPGDRMKLSPNGSAYFLIGSQVVGFDTSLRAVQATPIKAPAGVFGFYGIGVDPTTGAIYVTDAKDFVTPGDVYVFEPTGTQLDKFAADIIPRAFGFVR